MKKTQVRSLGQEEPLEKGKATHFSSLMCKIPWTEEPDELQSMGLQRVGHDWATNTFTYAYLMPGGLQTLLQFFSTFLKMNWLPDQWGPARWCCDNKHASSLSGLLTVLTHTMCLIIAQPATLLSSFLTPGCRWFHSHSCQCQRHRGKGRISCKLAVNCPRSAHSSLVLTRHMTTLMSKGMGWGS